jgi:hypothetical protein
MKLVNEQKIISWVDLVEDMKDFIINHYNGKSLKRYRRDWKRILKLSIQSIGYTFVEFDNYAWTLIDEAIKDKKNNQKISTKTTYSRYKLSEEKTCVFNQFLLLCIHLTIIVLPLIQL